MKRFLGLVFAGMALTACVTVPDTAPDGSRLTPQQLGLDGSTSPAISDTWWRAFDDPQLDALVDQALKDSPTLAAALARMRFAQADLSANRAARDPQIAIDGEEQRQRFSESYIIPPPFGGTTRWVGTVEAKLEWSLDFWGRQSAMVAMARSSAEAAALDAAAARLALSAAVTQAYIELSRVYALQDLAAAAVAQRASILLLTNSRVRNGLESTAAQKSAEALLALARMDRARTDGELEVARHQIAALIGRGADVWPTLSRPRLNPDAIALPRALPADLLARRADIQAARARIDAALSGREAARKAFYPDIDISAFAGWSAIGLDPMFSAAARTYGAGPAIHLPVFDAGALRAQYAGATASLDAVIADYNGSVVEAVKQTADALSRLRAVEEQASGQAVALGAAEESFRLAQIRYRNGLNTQLSVLDAETTLLQARTRSAALGADELSRRVELLVAYGGGFDLAAGAPLQDSTR